jgi:hypothetical protein
VRHDAHLIALTPNGQDVVRLCDGQRPDLAETYDLGVDTYGMCIACVDAAADLRAVRAR